jgi:hypothetical protein
VLRPTPRVDRSDDVPSRLGCHAWDPLLLACTQRFLAHAGGHPTKSLMDAGIRASHAKSLLGGSSTEGTVTGARILHRARSVLVLWRRLGSIKPWSGLSDHAITRETATAMEIARWSLDVLRRTLPDQPVRRSASGAATVRAGADTRRRIRSFADSIDNRGATFGTTSGDGGNEPEARRQAREDDH